MRFRYEARGVLDYRLPGTFKRPASQSIDDAGDQALMRSRLGTSIRFAPRAHGDVVLQDARVMGAEGSPGTSLANLDLFLAYVDIDSLCDRPVGVRVGRQVLAYGDQRVVAGSEWGNTGRAWDGARLRYTPRHLQVDAFMTWVMEGRTQGADRTFSGLDALWHGPHDLEAEAYTFGRSFGDSGFVSERGTKGTLHDWTSGVRTRVVVGRFDARLEAAAQRGRRAGDPVSATMAAARVAADLVRRGHIRGTLEAVQTSGDVDPTDGRVGRFDPVYWGGHGYQGAADVVGAGNVRDLDGTLAAQPTKTIGVQAEFHHFTLVAPRDAWADDAGTVLRRDATGAAGRALGREFDLSARWEPHPRLLAQLGWSHFLPGSFVARTGAAPVLDWGFAQFTVTL